MNKLIHNLELAIKAHVSGDLSTACQFYGQVLAVDPKHSFALGWMGTIEAQKGNYQLAEELLGKSVSLEPNNADFLANYANLFYHAEKYQEAIYYYKRSLTNNSKNPIAWSNMAACWNEVKNPTQALLDSQEALDLDANMPDAWSNRGNAFSCLKRYDEAIKSFDRALELRPDYPEAWSNRGVALKNQKKIVDALVSFERALQLRPDYAEAWCNRGVAFSDLNQHGEAIACFERAIQLNPNYAEAWYNRALDLKDLKYIESALECLERALEIDSNYAEAWNNKGIILNDLNRYEESIHCHLRALEIKSDLDYALGILVHTKMKICDWSAFDENLNVIRQGILKGKKVIIPLPLLALTDDTTAHQAAARIFSEDEFGAVGAYPVTDKPRVSREKIHIAYYSADFRVHPVGYLTAELFEGHDKKQFEITGFYLGPRTSDDLHVRISRAFDKFIHVEGMTTEEIASMSRSISVDIAVDLGGHTMNSPTGIFANRCAPIQVNYLGYPGTLGASFMDYIIADKTVASNEFRSGCTEKIVYMPKSFQVNDSTRKIPGDFFSRKDFDLPGEGFVYCCLNNTYKIIPEIFQVWMDILRDTEKSVLWLLDSNPIAKCNLRRQASMQGVDPERLIFASKTKSYDDYLARFRCADLFLDTFPFNAHTTASDVLWAGIPLLTLQGKSFASRVASSLLKAIEIPELITLSKDAYRAKAIQLATHPDQLYDLKKRLRNVAKSSALFDGKVFARHLESAFKVMQQRYEDNSPVEDIFIVSDE